MGDYTCPHCQNAAFFGVQHECHGQLRVAVPPNGPIWWDDIPDWGIVRKSTLDEGRALSCEACGIARPHYHRDTLDGDEVQWINPLDRGPLVETLFPLAPWERKCRQCGCSDERACVDPSLGPCGWVEWDLCSACWRPDWDATCRDDDAEFFLPMATADDDPMTMHEWCKPPPFLILDDVPWNGETTRAWWEWALLGAAFLAVFLLALWLLT